MLALTFGGWCLVCTVAYMLFLAAFIYCWARLCQRRGRDEET